MGYLPQTAEHRKRNQPKKEEWATGRRAGQNEPSKPLKSDMELRIWGFPSWASVFLLGQ